MITITCDACYHGHGPINTVVARTVVVAAKPTVTNTRIAVDNHLSSHHPDQMLSMWVGEGEAIISWPGSPLSLVPPDTTAPTATFRHPRALTGLVLGIICWANAITDFAAGPVDPGLLWAAVGSLWITAGVWADDRG